MLIRVTGHFIDNPNHIDKLIAIKGIPEDWIFKETKNGKELLKPWEPDVDINIPKSIRHLCEPVEVTVVFPPIEKGRESVIDKRTILGLKLDFLTGPGRDMWEKVEEYLDRSVPRDQRVPKPALVAPNQKSEFNPHIAKRTVRGSLELQSCEIPEIILPQLEKKVEVITTSNAQAVIIHENIIPAKKQRARKPDGVFKCDECPKVFTREQAIRMHKTMRHKKIEVPVVEQPIVQQPVDRVQETMPVGV